MAFKAYPKIHRLGTEETEGILVGTCTIQEKVDGANVSIWKNEDGSLGMGSRTQDITGGSFNGFCEYVRAHEGINRLLDEFPHFRLYGEWLVRHSIAYNELSYKKFYLFDIYHEITDVDGEVVGQFMAQDDVFPFTMNYDIDTPQVFATIEHPTIEQIMPYVGQSCLGPKGEGVVIKNPEFINKFGELRYAKIVTESFKEENALLFGGNNKHSESYFEVYCMNKYMTTARVQKVMNKIEPTLQIESKLGMIHTARIINTAYHDLITEEIWEIQKKCPTLNFKKLQVLCTRKAAKIYHELLLPPEMRSITI